MRNAVDTMNQAKGPEEIETAWEDFIAAAGTFFSTIEQGAKADNKGWLDKKKHERGTDPLLSYLQQARHAEEHGIERVTGRASSAVTLKGEGSAVTLVDTAKGTWTVTEASGDVEFANDRVRLVRVYNRGRWYDPPTHHLGKELENTSLVAVAGLGLAYFEEVFAEARDLAQ